MSIPCVFTFVRASYCHTQEYDHMPSCNVDLTLLVGPNCNPKIIISVHAKDLLSHSWRKAFRSPLTSNAFHRTSTIGF